jgi:hypothetical protein
MGTTLLYHEGHFTPRERAPCTHWIEACLGLKALDMVKKIEYVPPAGCYRINWKEGLLEDA